MSQITALSIESTLTAETNAEGKERYTAMVTNGVTCHNTVCSSRLFLIGVVALAGGAALTACGAASAASPLSCAAIKNGIADDNTLIAKLQRQKASTTYPPQVTHINQQIAAERDDITLKQGQAKDMKCS